MVGVCLIYELVTPSVRFGTLWFSYLVGVVLFAIGLLLTFTPSGLWVRRRKVQFSVICEQDISSDLDKEVREILVKCFPADREYFARQSWWHCVPLYRVIGRDSKGAIVAHMAVVDRTVIVGDESTKMRVAGVQGFCVSRVHRGTDLSRRMMYIAMEEAIKRRFDAGLLFCIPELEPLYTGMGWRKLKSNVFMYDEEKGKIPIPDKNITMFYPPGKSQFPQGDVDLNGTDW
jgi:hypothetical protein